MVRGGGEVVPGGGEVVRVGRPWSMTLSSTPALRSSSFTASRFLVTLVGLENTMPVVRGDSCVLVLLRGDVLPMMINIISKQKSVKKNKTKKKQKNM